jgi:hypothetical protein
MSTILALIDLAGPCEIETDALPPSRAARSSVRSSCRVTERFASCACGKLRSVAQENYARIDVRLS